MDGPRRNLVRWLGGGLSASLVSFLYPVFKFMNPPDILEASFNEVVAITIRYGRVGGGSLN
jgi:hypothetical protein